MADSSNTRLDARIAVSEETRSEFPTLDRIWKMPAYEGKAVLSESFELAQRYESSRVECEKLVAALRPFADECELGGPMKCVGHWDTGYICGIDSEGEPIYRFTEFCRYCVAHNLLAEFGQQPTGDDA